MHRRTFIKHCLCTASGLLAGILRTKPALAMWPTEHFENNDFSVQFQKLFTGRALVDSPEIELSLPDLAENGAVVPITISSDLDGINKIYIWVEKNPTPLAAEFELEDSVMPYITARIKMAESCDVIVVADQGSRLLVSRKRVNVMLGGCGTG